MSILRKYIREVIENEATAIQPGSMIYCDMDGVLVDFESAIIEMTNGLLDGGDLQGVPMSKKFIKRLTKVQDELGAGWRVQTGSDLNIKVVRNLMFGAIGANPGPIFAGMQPLTDGTGELWSFLHGTGHVVSLLSAPVNAKEGATMTAGDGKRLWAKQWLKPAPADIIITPATQKPDHAVTNGVPHILIDDRSSTIASWNERGGIGILHIPGNSGKTIAELRKLGL